MKSQKKLQSIIDEFARMIADTPVEALVIMPTSAEPDSFPRFGTFDHYVQNSKSRTARLLKLDEARIA